MQAELCCVFSNAADAYLEREQRRLQNFYETGIEAEFGELILQMTQETADFYLSLLSALNGVPTKQLLDSQKAWRNFCKKDARLRASRNKFVRAC